MKPFSIYEAALQFGHRRALIVDDRSFSYRMLASLVEERRSTIKSQPGTPPRVIRAENDLDTLVLIYALMEMDIPFAPLHPKLSSVETKRLHEILAKNPLSAQNPLVVMFTSGTEGTLKGAVLTKEAFMASARGSATNLGWEEDDHWICPLPICHIGGFSIITRCLMAGACVVLCSSFDPKTVLHNVANNGGTLMSVVPTMLDTLLAADTQNHMARLRAVLVGGGDVPLSLLEECEKRGVVALATYGMTETCSQLTVQPLKRPHRAMAGAGLPLPGSKVKIVDHKGEVLPTGEVGKIFVSGETLMWGYLGGSPIADDGYFETSDLGSLDKSNHLHIAGRESELIVTGGENVYPKEVEQALCSLPQIKEAIVFGEPDEKWGQRVAAAIVFVKSQELELLELKSLLEGLLAAFKFPKVIYSQKALPRLPNGKIDRKRASALATRD